MMDYLRSILPSFLGGNVEPEEDEEFGEEEESEDDEQPLTLGKREHKKVDYSRVHRGEDIISSNKRTTPAKTPKTPKPKSIAPKSTTPKKRTATASIATTPASSRKKVKTTAEGAVENTPKKTPAGKKGAFGPNLSSKGKWTFSWTKGEVRSCFVRDRTGNWFEAKPLDVINNGDPRLEFATTELLVEKRGLKAKVQTPSEFKVSEGDWVRVHFHGWNVKYDEWILFTRGGYICTKELGPCFCGRHKTGLAGAQDAIKQAPSAKKATSEKKSKSTPKKVPSVPKKASSTSK